MWGDKIWERQLQNFWSTVQEVMKRQDKHYERNDYARIYKKKWFFNYFQQKKKARNLPPNYSNLVIFFMFYKLVFRRWYFFPGFSHSAWDAHFLHICMGLNSLFMPTLYLSDGSLIIILLLQNNKKEKTKNNKNKDNCYAEIHRQK